MEGWFNIKLNVMLLLVLLITTACSSTPVIQNGDTSKTGLLVASEQTTRKIELEKRSIISNKVEISLPKNFTIMSEDMAKLKYPSERRPTLIYTDEEASINVAFNYMTTIITDKEISLFKEATKKNLENVYPSATWLEDTVVMIHNKNVGKLEVITPAVDTKVYNLIFFMELEGKLLMASFNCTENQMQEWQPIAHEIVESIKIK